MKRSFSFILFLAAMSAVSGMLMSKASWIGRLGMTLFYKEYNLLKIWWQGGLAVFLVLMVLFYLQYLLFSKSHIALSRIVNFLLFAAAAGGAYLTYDDFTGDFSHHLLGWRFHLGFYLIWADWAMISIFFLFKRKGAARVKRVAPKGEAIQAPSN